MSLPSLLLSFIFFTCLTSCASETDTVTPDSLLPPVEKESYDWQKDPTLYMDQGYLDPETGEFVPAQMKESEEARLERLQDELQE